MKSTPPRSTHFFDTRSVMLIAAMALGGGASLHAQTPSPPAQSTGQSPFTTGGTPKAPMGIPNPASAAFDRADTNHDGVVSPDERKAAHEKMRAMHEQRKGGKPGEMEAQKAR